MSKRKTFIELQNKPENKLVRQLFDKTKPVDYAPITSSVSKIKPSEAATESQKAEAENNLETATGNELKKSPKNKSGINAQAEEQTQSAVKHKNDESDLQRATGINKSPKGQSDNSQPNPLLSNIGTSAQAERLRIFQTSTPITRTVTRFQKAAIVVRGENGKQLVELFWRDQMNEKTKDIWNFFVVKFNEAENLNSNEILIRKREILNYSGVKSDRTFISAIYTLEDMGLIEVKRLSGNKEGNLYILTDEGREEIDGYRK